MEIVMGTNRLRMLIDTAFTRSDLEKGKKEAIRLVKQRIQPMERDYLAGKISLDDLLRKSDPIQKKIFDIANVLPVLKNTFRHARPGEMFFTNTLLRRIENAEILKEQRENSI